jgi:hypothetical protein
MLHLLTAFCQEYLGAAAPSRSPVRYHPDPTRCTAVVEEIEASGGVARAVSTDVRSEEAVQALFANRPVKVPDGTLGQPPREGGHASRG